RETNGASLAGGTRWLVGIAVNASAARSCFALTPPTPAVFLGSPLQTCQQGRQPSSLARQTREPELLPRPLAVARSGPGGREIPATGARRKVGRRHGWPRQRRAH